MSLNSDELVRYTRHFNLRELGMDGQQRLKNARVLCIGAGGLGSAALYYLCAAGVGTLGIVDADVVELTNLQRQILYTTADIKKFKVAAAAVTLNALNPHVTIVTYPHRLTHNNALELIAAYDIVVDGTDNFASRYLINDACFHLSKPNVYASIFQFSGQCSVFTAKNGPCYRCLYAEAPPAGSIPNCADGGVLGVLPGLMGTLQATETIKLITGMGSPLIGRLLTVDILNFDFQELQLNRHADCCLCIHKQSFASLNNHFIEGCSMPTTTLNTHAISVVELKDLQAKKIDFQLVDVREPEEFAIYNLNGLLIPLAELPQRLTELDKNKPIVVHCKADARSQIAAQLLQNAGFHSVSYLRGGILAWAEETP